jgi:hypothetical protein
MALNEIQWGRILALAWRDNNFKVDFEKDPEKALRSHGRSKNLLIEFGIDPTDPIVDVTIIQSGGPNFAQAHPQVIDAVIRGNQPAALPEDSWFWDSILQGNATQPAATDLITLGQWGKIYARIWMDERLHESTFQPFRATYGPKRNYLRQFEKNPAVVVNLLTGSSLAGPPLNISYTPNVTRLFVLIGKPTTWSDAQLDTIIDTGEINGHPVKWMAGKCC